MPPPSIVADRYLPIAHGYVDLATGERVRLHVRRAPRAADQVTWAERCAILSRLRHPLLIPPIDYGVAGRTSIFTAYPDVNAVRTIPAGRLGAHLARFLEAHGVVALDDHLEPLQVRRLPRLAALSARVIGHVIQGRRALEEATAWLDAPAGAGVRPFCIAAAEGAGLRTLHLCLAAAARVRGYAPLSIASLVRWPQVVEATRGRHVCLFVMLDSPPHYRHAFAALLARLAVESGRRHACFILCRREAPVRALPLERMGVAALTGMVFIDRKSGPRADEVFEAARASDGLPGRFLAALGASTYPTADSAPPPVVHESPAPYAVEREAGCAAVGARRIGRVARGALGRAQALSDRGRHAAALRLLGRAERVLEGRGERARAAACALQRAWIARARGDVDGAIEACDRACRLAIDPRSQVDAAIAQSVCWTDAGRLLEAEAALRTTLIAARALADEALEERCVLALARALYWRRSPDEALDLLQPLADSSRGDPHGLEARLLRARAHLLRDELSAAVVAVRRSLDEMPGESPRLAALGHRMMAEAMTRAGDLAAVRAHVADGLRAAARAHLPLHRLKLRTVLLRALLLHGHPDGPRLDSLLTRALARPRVPVLLRSQLALAAGRPDVVPPVVRASAHTWPRLSAGNALEELIAAAHRARDDGQAMEAVGDLVAEQMECASIVVAGADSRILRALGRPWRDRSAAAAQALAAGSVVLPDPSKQPPEAAAPIRYGGEILGAVACRWVVGHIPDLDRTSSLLRAAALALAPHVRSTLEAIVPDPPAGAWADLIGDSAPAAALRTAVQRAARAPFPVLVEGESGSGKELVARAVHRLGPRRERRFCAINCAAISDELVEAELFGHARGAFTGAAGERAGLFEEADGGTLFLDEIGELSARAQAKLLRVLQEGEVRRVGENFPRKVDVRIVAATNRRLPGEVEAGRFRADLRFRLDVIRITVPPLRERVADIAPLALHFWAQATARVGSRATLAPDALAALSRYHWPGNVRELQNVIAWMAVHAPPRGRVTASLLPAHLASAPLGTGTFEAAREEFERRFVRAALATAGGQRGRAARALGVSRQGLAKMLRRLGIEEEARR